MVMRSTYRSITSSDLRGILIISASVFIMGLAYGASAHSVGFPVWQILMLSLLVLGGASELLFVGLLAGGAGIVTAVVAGFVVNLRNAAYGTTAGAVVGRSPFALLAAHMANDETAALAQAQSDRRRARAVFLIGGLFICGVWPISAGLGALLGSVLSDPKALGLDAVLPAVLLALALPMLRDRSTLIAALAGAVIAVAAAPLLPAGLAPLVALIGLLTLWRPRRLRRPGAAETTATAGTTETTETAETVETVETQS